MIFLAKWFTTAEPKKIVTAVRWMAGGLGLVLAGFLILGGPQLWAFLLLPLLIPFFRNFQAVRHRIKAAQGPSPGQTSEVGTRFLRMTLNHDSGEMSGLVLEGRFRGRTLDELDLQELVALWRECRAQDVQSAAVLEAFLDRNEGEAWRDLAGQGAESPGAGTGAAEAAMTREEAHEILGLQPGAAKPEILEAHRRLMQKIHPDHGGSNYLAAKINQAKDLLLGA